MTWEPAPDIAKILTKILKTGIFPQIFPDKITTLRGLGSTSRAIARIWSLPRPWQLALSVEPQYVIEVISERFDKLTLEEKEKTLIHELMHIPRTFSGSLLAHRNRGQGINRKTVETKYFEFKNAYKERPCVRRVSP